MFKLLTELYETPGGGTGGGKLDTADGIYDFLKDDEPEKPETIDLEDKPEKEEAKPEEKKEKKKVDASKKEDKEEKPEGDEEELEIEDELKQIEEDLEEPELDEEAELQTPASRREILKKYPELFKDFPVLQAYYYKGQQYSEIFPTLDDAKQAKQDANVLINFEQDLVAGNTEKLLAVVKKDNPKGFNKIVDNYLSTLERVDDKAYIHVVGNIIKHTIMDMVKEARSGKDDDLLKAAEILNKHVFRRNDFEPPTRLSNDKEEEKEDPRAKEIEERERALHQRQYDSVSSELNGRINNALKATIDQNIDPKDSMTPYVKRAATDDVFNRLSSLIEGDKKFRTLVDRLWEAAIKDGYSEASKNRIKSAFFAKAKPVLRTLIKSARIEALKGMGKRVREEKEEDTTQNKGHKREVSRSRESDRKDDDERKPRRGESTYDFLSR